MVRAPHQTCSHRCALLVVVAKSARFDQALFIGFYAHILFTSSGPSMRLHLRLDALYKPWGAWPAGCLVFPHPITTYFQSRYSKSKLSVCQALFYMHFFMSLDQAICLQDMSHNEEKGHRYKLWKKLQIDPAPSTRTKMFDKASEYKFLYTSEEKGLNVSPTGRRRS